MNGHRKKYTRDKGAQTARSRVRRKTRFDTIGEEKNNIDSSFRTIDLETMDFKK